MKNSKSKKIRSVFSHPEVVLLGKKWHFLFWLLLVHSRLEPNAALSGFVTTYLGALRQIS